MSDFYLPAALVAVSLLLVIVSVGALRLRREVRTLKRELALTRYSAVLPAAEKRKIAQGIRNGWARRAARASPAQKSLIQHYCLEAAKEISLVYNRPELLAFTIDDVKRSLDLLYAHCKRFKIARVRASKALEVIQAYAATSDVRFYYSAGRAVLDAATMNWVWFAYHIAFILLPKQRRDNAATVWFAGYLAQAIYEGAPADEPGTKLDTALATHRFAAGDRCERCGVAKTAVVLLRTTCPEVKPTLRSRLRTALRGAGSSTEPTSSPRTAGPRRRWRIRVPRRWGKRKRDVERSPTES